MLDKLRYMFRRDVPYEDVGEVVETTPDPGMPDLPVDYDPIGAQGDDAAGAETHKKHPELGSFTPRHRNGT